jgi:hypothetical protein
MATVKIDAPVPFGLPVLSAPAGTEWIPLDVPITGTTPPAIITMRATAQSIANLFASSGNIVGTANEITVTSTGGVVTIALAPNIIIPAPASGVTLEVDSIDQTSTSVNTAGGLAIDVTSNGTSVGSGGVVAFSANNSAWRFASIKGLVQNAAGNSVGNLSFATRRLTGDATLTEAMNINLGGNVTIDAPASGTALTVNAVSGGSGVFVNTLSSAAAYAVSGPAATQINALQIQQSGQTAWTLYEPASTSDLRFFAGADRVVFTAAGNVTINAPTSGVALTVTAATGARGVVFNGVAGQYTQKILGSSTSGQSFGLNIQAGTISTDYALFIGNAAASIEFMRVWGDGGLTIGVPTGGNKGAGTLNAATQLYVNNLAAFQTGTFTGTLTGCTTAVTGTMTWTRSFNIVTVYSPLGMTGTSNAATFTMTGLPAAIQPAAEQLCACSIENNGSNSAGYAEVSGSGTVTFAIGLVSGTLILYSSGSFTASGVKGLNATSFTYSMQ